MTSGNLDLDQIEARAAQLDTDEYNQGVPKNAPWRAHASRSGRDRWTIYQPTGSDQSRVITEGLGQPFADFIAHSREDVPALVAEVRRLREEVEHGNWLTGSFEQGMDEARGERDAARAEADDLRRQLLNETYRPEGVEIVMRELGIVKRERDAAVAEAARVREALTGMTETLERITTERNAFRDERNEAREALQAASRELRSLSGRYTIAEENALRVVALLYADTYRIAGALDAALDGETP